MRGVGTARPKNHCEDDDDGGDGDDPPRNLGAAVVEVFVTRGADVFGARKLELGEFLELGRRLYF